MQQQGVEWILQKGRRQTHSSKKKRRATLNDPSANANLTSRDVRRPSIPLSVREGEEGRRRDGIRWGCLPLSSRVSRGAFTPRWKALHGEGGVVGKRVDNRGCTPFPPPTGTLSTRGNRLGSLCLPIPPAFSTPSPSFLLLLNFPLHLNFWSCFFSLSYNSRIRGSLSLRIFFFLLSRKNCFLFLIFDRSSFKRSAVFKKFSLTRPISLQWWLKVAKDVFKGWFPFQVSWKGVNIRFLAIRVGQRAAAVSTGWKRGHRASFRNVFSKLSTSFKYSSTVG